MMNSQNARKRTTNSERARAFASARPPTLGRALLEILRVARQDLDDVVSAAFDAAGEIAGAKARQDGVVDDRDG